MSYGNYSYAGSAYSSTSNAEIVRVDSAIKTVGLLVTEDSVSKSSSVDSVSSREAVSVVTKSDEISFIEELSTLSIGDATTSLNFSSFSASVDPSIRAESSGVSFDLFSVDDVTKVTENSVKESVLSDVLFSSENSVSLDFSKNSDFETVSIDVDSFSQVVDSVSFHDSVFLVSDSTDSSVSIDNSVRLLSNVMPVISDEISNAVDFSSSILLSLFSSNVFVSNEISLLVDESVLSASVSPVGISLETSVAFVNSVDNALITSVLFESSRSTTTTRLFIDDVLVGVVSLFSDVDLFTFARDESVNTFFESVEFTSNEIRAVLENSRKSLSTSFSERIDVLTEAVAEGTVFVVGSSVVVLTDDDIFFVVTSVSDGKSSVELLRETSKNDVRVLNE